MTDINKHESYVPGGDYCHLLNTHEKWYGNELMKKLINFQKKCESL